MYSLTETWLIMGRNTHNGYWYLNISSMLFNTIGIFIKKLEGHNLKYLLEMWKREQVVW